MLKFLIVSLFFILASCDSPQAEVRNTDSGDTNTSDLKVNENENPNTANSLDPNVNPYLPEVESNDPVVEEDAEDIVEEEEEAKPITIPIYESIVGNDHDYIKTPVGNDPPHFFVFKDEQPDTIPLYRCIAGSNHYLYTVKDCGASMNASYQFIEEVGYIYTDPAKAIQLIRCYDSGIPDLSMANNSAAECPSGYTSNELPFGSTPKE